MSLISRTKKGIAAALTACMILGGTPMLMHPVQASPLIENIQQFGEEALKSLYLEMTASKGFMKKLEQSEEKLFAQFYSSCKNKDFETANKYIRELIQRQEELNHEDLVGIFRVFRSFMYMTFADLDRTIADAEKDIEHDSKDSFAYSVRVRALLLKAYQKTNEVNTDEMTYALDELDKTIGFFVPEDAAEYHRIAISIRSQRDEYPKALEHAEALVALLPKNPKALELRADCWSGMDKDFRKMRGESEKEGKKIEEWRISRGKENAIIDLTLAILLEETFDRYIKRAALEKELYSFKDAWEDINYAKLFAKTDDDKALLVLHILSLQKREKESKEANSGE